MPGIRIRQDFMRRRTRDPSQGTASASVVGGFPGGPFGAKYTGFLTACPTLRVTSGEYAVHWGERFGNLLNCGTKVRYSVSACPVLPKNRSPPALRV